MAANPTGYEQAVPLMLPFRREWLLLGWQPKRFWSASVKNGFHDVGSQKG